MTALVPGRFTIAAIRIDGGELEVRLSDGGHWQVKAKLVEEGDWRSLCRGHIDGSIFDTAKADDQAPVRVGALLVDQAARRVEVHGHEVRLAAREFELVALLATEPDRVFTKQELMRELWGRRGSFRTLDSHASRARCKLREAGAAGFVVNCHAHGYRLRDAGGQR
ncbi:MAG TPA: winged helix-turn-helix domain-containing protein [Solirubrobacterales bacterium]|nr:winged helix-turn-helix domain-containing protein [Solirubrobacterales bacterium]